MVKLIVVPNRLSLHGVRLEPLTISHEDNLVEACQDGKLWELTVTSVPKPDKVSEYIHKAESTSDRVAFAVIDESTGKAIGSTSYHDILPLAKRLDIGYTWYAKSYWCTHVNTACKLMLLTYAFDQLNYLTVGWRTDRDNIQSQKAIERLGAKKDGIIRGDRVRRDGVIGDTVKYSMTVDEWQIAKANLQAKLTHYLV